MIRRLLVSKLITQVLLLVCDVDGVLTDAGFYYDERGGVLAASMNLFLARRQLPVTI